jgi:hypothetical protein
LFPPILFAETYSSKNSHNWTEFNRSW